MPYSGSGSFSVYTPGNPAVTGTTISSTAFNNTMNDFASGLSNAMTRDGQSPATSNIPLGNNRITGLANGTARTDAATVAQIQDGGPTYLTSVSGTNTITASLTGLAAYTAGQSFRFIAAGANTGAVTLNVNGLGAKAITKNGSTALASGDIPSGALIVVNYDGTQFQLFMGASGSYAQAGANNDITSLGALTTVPTVVATYASQVKGISASVAANAMTVSASALSLDFRSTTLGSGTVTTVSGTPSNLVIPASATLGTVNAVQSDIYVLAINNAGTIELAVVNVSGGVDLSETGLISTTAISGLATSASVIYSTTARTNVAYRVIGLIRSTQATAGTWATAPSLIQGAGGNALDSLGSLGYGQTWQNVSGSRVLGTTYYNTTGKPITVSVTCGSAFTGGSATVTASVSGVSIATWAVNESTGASYQGNTQGLTFPVPAGMSYGVSVSAGSATINSWTELR